MAGRAGRDSDPLVGHQFGIDFKGKVTGYFTECSGLESETDVVEHKIVGDKGQTGEWPERLTRRGDGGEPWR